MVKRGEISVSVDDRNLLRRLARVQKKLDETGKLSVEEVARHGRDLIQDRMPKKTGDSAESIGYTVLVNAPGNHIAQILQISEPHPGKEWHDEWFNIPLWMFTSDKAIAHYARSNGDIIGLRNVINELRIEFGEEVKIKFKNPTIFM
jgi:hypothetical protein